MTIGSDRVMLITGASQRIGAAIARLAHELGFRVVIHYRASSESAAQLAASLNRLRPDSAVCLSSDFADPTGCAVLIESAVTQWGGLDVLVNNASEFFPTPVGSIALADIQKTFNANVFAPLLLTQAALPSLRARRGAVVNILDIYAEQVHPAHSVYCASKAALAMLTRALALECAPEVRVNGVAPGAILWPQGDSAVSEEVKANMLEKIPLRKTGTAEQIAAAVTYLCSEDAAFITGQTITMDGGRTL